MAEVIVFLIFLIGMFLGVIWEETHLINKKEFKYFDKKYILTEVKEEKQLYSCPYDLIVGCVMDHPCKGCKEFNANKYEY